MPNGPETTETDTCDIARIIDRYGGDTGMLIPMMQDIQAECGYLPQTELKELSGGLVVPLSRIYSVATFYSSFRLLPKGDHTIQLCMGTVCFLKGADKIRNAIQQEFELVPGGTSPDRKFTFSPVNCVGACALAPVMVVDGEYHGGLSANSAVELLHKIAVGDEPPEVDAGTGNGKKKKKKTGRGSKKSGSKKSGGKKSGSKKK